MQRNSQLISKQKASTFWWQLGLNPSQIIKTKSLLNSRYQPLIKGGRRSFIQQEKLRKKIKKKGQNFEEKETVKIRTFKQLLPAYLHGFSCARLVAV